MWVWKMTRCGCNPVQEPFEFPIENILFTYNSIINIDCVKNKEQQEIFNLKQKIIQDFLDIINKLECGIQLDLEQIKQEISIIYIKENGDNVPNKKYKPKSPSNAETQTCVKPLNNKEIDKMIQKIYGM